MATMWLLLVNTLKSTGQWYFPGEGGAGVERGSGVGVWGQRGSRNPEGLPKPLL